MISASVSALFYALATALQVRRSRGKLENRTTLLYALALLAVAAHGYSVFTSVVSPSGVHLGLFSVSSLIFWIINLAFLLSLLGRPLQNLMVILFPLSAAAVLTAALAPSEGTASSDFTPGMIFHIGSSVLAYAVLTIAACQAAAVAVQDYQLRHRHTRGLVQILPPLQLMETMLFEILWAGLVLLTLAIASGMLFLDDIFAQHLVHKTVLTICAWLLFAILLWGHHQLGWRSQTAVRLTLAGFVVLVLGYSGSKLVLELILERV